MSIAPISIPQRLKEQTEAVFLRSQQSEFIKHHCSGYPNQSIGL